MRSAALPAITVLVCAVELLAQGRPARPPRTEVDKAVEEFKTITRELGVRADGPRKPANGVKAAWHGRIFENFRNDFLDAVPHEVVQRGGDKSTLRRNQFGFNIAGPVVIPRLYHGRRTTYFSLSYEGVRERISRSYLRTIPTLDERAGDWSATVDQAGDRLRIYDPLTTSRNPAHDPSQPVSEGNLEYSREPFPDNQIPISRLDPVAQNALAYYPAPNTAAGPFFRNNYFIHSPETNEANGFIAKLDHSIRERHRVSLGITYSDGLLGSARYFPTAANPGPVDRRFQTRTGSLEHVWTGSARTVNTATFEASTNGSETEPEDETSYPEAIGLENAPGQAFPALNFADYLDLGRAYPVSKNVRNVYAITNAFSTRRGKHGMRIVGQLAWYQVNTFWPRYPSATLRFGSGLTSLPGIINTGHEFASFLLGLSEYAEVSLVGSPSYFRRSTGLLGYRHNYEAWPGLTFSFGLNMEPRWPRTEKYDRQTTVDLSAGNPANGRPGALIAAGRGGVGRSFQPFRLSFEPSASVAWNPRGDTRTVVRGSFARSYAAIPIYFGQWGTQGFNGNPTFISPNVQLEPALTLRTGLPPLAARLPDLRPDAANDTVADLVDRSGLQPVYQSATLSVEREVPGSVVITVGTDYSGGRNLLVGNGAANPNALPLSALEFRDRLNDEDFNRSLRPFPQYKGFDVYSSWPLGHYQRNEAFIRAEKRASQGLTIAAGYEWAKQMDDYSGPYGSQDFYDRGNEWSLTPGHNPHRWSFSYNYELPRGWSLSGLTRIYSGEPLALRAQFNNTGGVVQALHVNVVPGVDAEVADPGPDLWFNPAAFDQPPDFTIGDAARTHPTLRGPITQNHDLSLTKRFDLAADRAIEFSAVGLNFLNHANWTDPDVVIGPSSAPNVNAGKIIGSKGGRVIQLGLRLTF
jgi:hypothetical protein